MRTATALLVLLLTACGTTMEQASVQDPRTQCADPRPQVCTMEYAPVCADLIAGSTKEYSSPCNAIIQEDDGRMVRLDL